MRQITRILAITSIHQLIVGLACMEKNKKESDLYNDYLLINNTMLNDEAVESIKNISENFKFSKIIDFRQRLEWVKEYKNFGFNKYSQLFPKIFRLLIQNFLYYQVYQYKALKKVMSELTKMIDTDSKKQIYLRYKLSLPEKLLLHTFVSSDIYLFEDGLGDYIPKSEFKDFNNFISFKSFIIKIKKIILKMFGKDKDQHLLIDKMVYERIKGIYELINNRDGWKKQDLLMKASINPVDIKAKFIAVLKQLDKSLFLNEICDNSIIYLPSIYSARDKKMYPGEWCSLEDEILYIDQIIQSIEKLYPDSKIILKTHPRSPQYLIDEYVMNFNYKLTILGSINCPGEVLFLDNKVKAVVGGFTSSLIYAKNIFNKEAYFTPLPSDGRIWYSDSRKINIIENSLISLGIKKLRLI